MLCRLVITTLALAGLSVADWRVNFYSSADCSAKSLTSTHTGTDFYVEHTVSPKGQYLIITKDANGRQDYQGAFASSDNNGGSVTALIGQGCVKGPVGGASSFQVA
ncbi:hypothetical protein BGZ63DRAFT_252096 [Mariannaea sp. PMI_226]|nr:hypothetical protein BGZ63DRAFT_252096 [Mariannaea sp. PMI_226]